MKIEYNSPIILNFTFLSGLVLILGSFLGEWFQSLFILFGNFQFGSLLNYFRLVSYIFGHADFTHYIGNFTLILLVGPMLEEKFGSTSLLKMMFFTAITTAIINLIFFGDNILGASGIVFMMIMLSSFTSYTSGKIPLTFLLVFGLFIGKEVVSSFSADHVSQFGHIMGGICGAVFGFVLTKSSHESA